MTTCSPRCAASRKLRTGSEIRDLSNADEAVLSSLVAASREAIEKGRAGLDRPFQVPVVYDLNDISTRLMNESGAIRGGFARMLFAQGRLAELQGQLDQAVQSFLDLARLGDAMSHKVPSLPHLVSTAIATQGLHGLRSIRSRLTGDQCRRVIAVLEDLDERREPIADVVLREQQFITANVNKMGMMAKFSFTISGVLAKEKARAASTLEEARAGSTPAAGYCWPNWPFAPTAWNTEKTRRRSRPLSRQS